MNCHYLVVRETYMDDVSPRTAYGIAAVKEYDGCTAVMQSIPDVCPEFAPVQQLVQYCNALHLDLIQLHDIVEDFHAMAS